MSRTADIGAALERSLDERWERFRREVKNCRKACTEKATHDLRVSLRRLVSVLDTLRILPGCDAARGVRRRLKKYIRLFRELRDVQVQRPVVGDLFRRHPALAFYRDVLRKREEGLIKRVGRRARTIRPGRLARALAPLRRRVRGLPANDAGREECLVTVIGAVDAAFGKVIRHRPQVAAADLQAVHRMRIAFKKFRYTAEAVQPLLADVTDEKLRRMGRFQLLLGRIHDNHVLSEDLRAFAGRGSSATDALGPVLTELSAQRDALLESLRGSMDDLRTFWIDFEPAPPAPVVPPVVRSEVEGRL